MLLPSQSPDSTEKQKKQSAFHTTLTAGPIPQQTHLFGTTYPHSVPSDRKPSRALSASFLYLEDRKGPTLSGNLDYTWILTDALIFFHYQATPTRHRAQTAEALLHLSSDIKVIYK